MKKLIYLEHIILFLLVAYQIKGCVQFQTIQKKLSKNKVTNTSNAYFSEVSFWGNNRFFKETEPVVNNEYQDVAITPGMLVYTSDLISNKQCRVSLSLEKDNEKNGCYLLQLTQYNFEHGKPFSELVEQAMPLTFTISANGISCSENYSVSTPGTDGTHSNFAVYLTSARKQPEGAYMAYMYIGKPGSKFTGQDSRNFGTSPETFPSERLSGKLFRIIWNYSEWEDIKSDR